MSLPNISNYFQLTGHEQTQLTKCVKNYSQHLALSNIIHRIWNAICSVFGQSEWQQVSRLLQNRTFTAVQTKFSIPDTNREILKTRAKALSEFILRFLVTIHSPKRDFYFSPGHLKSFNGQRLDHFLEKAAYGNGKVLGISPRGNLTQKLQAERTSYIQDVDNFDHYLNNDPQLQAAKRIESQLQAATDSMRSISGIGIQRSINRGDNMLEQATRMVTESRQIFQQTDGIEDVECLNGKSIQQLGLSLNEISKMHQHFNKGVATLRTPLRGGFFGGGF